jgi:hypothetical protein
VCKCTSLHPDPLLLIDPDQTAAPAPDLGATANAVVFDDAVLPAMQEPALAYLPVLEDLGPALGTSYSKHTCRRVIRPIP